jgi:hypothetical protein
LPLPSSGISTSWGGGVGSETYFAMSSCSKRLGWAWLIQFNQYSGSVIIGY